jgi:hypothetical protein
MKHAWLIIAHNEFGILQRLISALDDPAFDFFVHFDRKVQALPTLTAEKSRIFILNNRVDVRWGHVSQIKAEFALFEEAMNIGGYDYYHMISGVHLPLKPVDAIKQFFVETAGSSVFSDFCRDSEYQEMLKCHRYNLFLKDFASPIKWKSRLCQFLWKSGIAIQRCFHIQRNRGIDFYKARQWVSLTQEALQLLLSRKESILQTYRWAFCSDEYFVPTELMHSPLEKKIIDSEDYLLCVMGRAHPRTYSLSEWESLRETGFLFARKFSEN